MQEFLAQFEGSLADDSFVSLTLSKPDRRDASDSPQRITVRRVKLRNGPQLQWTFTSGHRETHENLSPAQSCSRVALLLGPVFQHGHLFTTQTDVAARIDKSGICHVRRSPPSKSSAPTLAHNRTKEYLIPEGTPCPFLQALGVMTAAGNVRQAKQHKFRQINRFLELVDDVLPQLPAEGPLVVVDYGCGLSYLTFALHHLLSVIRGRDVQMTGIDANLQVIERCDQLRRKLDLSGLTFEARQIDASLSESKVHLAVSLHACDTATDDALASAVAQQAEVILAAPCCQHELAGQMDSESLELMTRHGILKERLSALATDALRAALLEAAGWRTQVVEFIDTEHTPKNLLIRAVRRTTPLHDGHWTERIRELKHLLGITEQRLESQLIRQGLLH